MRPIDADALTEKYGDWYTEEGTEEGYIGTIKDIVESMPSAQPDTDCNTCLRQACPHRDGTIRVNCPLWKESAI